MNVKTERKWFWRILDFINPLRDPSLTVAFVLTCILEAGQHDPIYLAFVILLINWLAVRGVVWLIVNFTFASTFIARRAWWAIRHPRLAWRIMDAIGHEEIVIGGIPTISDGILLPEGTTIMNQMNGFQVIGELPAGTQIPMLGMPGGQMAPDFSSFGNTGMFPGQQNFPPSNNNYFNQPTTDGYPPVNFQQQQQSSEEVEHLRQQIAAYTQLMEDWMQFTEEKWRAVSDSQLGWKPLRGRWNNWDDIFQDAYAAKTSDPMAQAAQVAGEATARRYDTSKDKGSAASAVACFMRDMMTLRRGFEMVQGSEGVVETPTGQPVVQPSMTFNSRSGPLQSGNLGNASARNSLIRRPAQIFVDADTNK